MADSPLQTSEILRWADRMQAGDDKARNDLIQRACAQLERLTRKMLKGYPGVRRWAETDDVFQSAVIRLHRALKEVRPTNTREFFGLATTQIRRELLDLARHYYGPQGLGANHASNVGADSAAPNPCDPADSQGDPAQLAVWKELHEKIDGLPPEQREVVGLLFYQGLTQAEAAEILQVTVRTVQNHWSKALRLLHEILKDAWAE